MNKILPALALMICALLFKTTETIAQVCEWRLVNPIFNPTDPDGAGPATGSVSFVFQVHTTSGSIPSVTGISCGWSYQSSAAMIPTTPGCATVNAPSNVIIAPGIFTTGGYAYNAVAQCNSNPQTVGGKSYDRTSSGSLEGSGITLTTTWTDAYTVTLWTLGSGNPQGGFVIINSGSTGSPNAIGSYGISDAFFNEYVTNSLTTTTPLSAGSVLPVSYTNFTSTCTDKGALVRWSTSNEINADYFELQRSKDGNDWSSVGKIKAKGNSTTEMNYEKLDDIGGAAFYRLKQFDVNGNIHFSSIIKTNCDIKNIEITIYPVPAKDVLNVVVQTDKAIKTQLGIYDAAGRMVRKINSNIVAGNNNLTINLVGLSNGQYIIRSLDYELPLNKKFTIIH